MSVEIFKFLMLHIHANKFSETHKIFTLNERCHRDISSHKTILSIITFWREHFPFDKSQRPDPLTEAIISY